MQESTWTIRWILWSVLTYTCPLWASAVKSPVIIPSSSLLPNPTRYSHAEHQEFLMEELQDRKSLNISGITVKGTALESYQIIANFGQTRYKLLCIKLVRLQGSSYYYSIAYPILNNDWKCLLSCFADPDHQFCYKFYHFYHWITFQFCQKVLLQPGLCPDSQLCPGTSQFSALWCSDIYGNLFSCLLKRSRKLF